LEDALLEGSLLLSLLRHGERVKIACLAQLINAIAPIMTEPGGVAWRQTIYFPFEQVSRFGRGEVVFTEVTVPTYATRSDAAVPYLDAVGVLNREEGILTLFAVNRSCDQPMALAIDLGGFTPLGPMSHWVMTGERADTTNGPHREVIRPIKQTAIPPADGNTTQLLPALSWNVFQLAVS
jgi:alpha-N-arabinofuranosidase